LILFTINLSINRSNMKKTKNLSLNLNKEVITQ
jgi:hypothetical protein